MSLLRTSIAVLISATTALVATEAFAAPCPGGSPTFVTHVDHTSPLGSRWRFDVYRAPCEGLVFTSVAFTPKGGMERIVLARANIAQIHVPYHNSIQRFHDLTTSIDGLGVLSQVLAAAECEGGTLFDGNRICVQIEDRGYAWKYGAAYAHGEEISVWSSSQLGSYNYINQWNFHDDGSIEPRAGLTGRLQLYSNNAADLQFGSRINPESASPPVIGLNHLHNIYYRLDFDINGAGNDAVDRISYTPHFGGSCDVAGECGKDILTRFTNESVDYLVPEQYTSWRVIDKGTVNADGRNIGYEIEPEIHGLWTGMSSTSEPWSDGEVWVTKYNGCELLAFDNVPPFISAGCGSPMPDVDAMAANAEPVDGADVVVWYVNRFRHFVRDEDDLNMPIEWVGFHIAPRSFHHQNPIQ